MDSRYVSICFSPRKTIRRIAETASDTHAIAIVAVAAILTFLADLSTGAPTVITVGSHRWTFGPGTSFTMNLALAVGMPLLAIAILYIDGALTRWIGHLLGGKANPAEMRAALAWPEIPSIFGTLLYMLLGLSGLARVISPQSGEPDWTWIASNSKTFFAVFLATGPFSLWTMILRIVCVSELHRFSLWRAVATRIIAVLAIVTAAALIAYGVETVHPGKISV